MQAGKLRHLVSVYEYIETRDTYGGVLPLWSEKVKMYASITPHTGREEYADKQVNTEQTHKIKMRYTPDIDSTMLIRFGDRIFGILGNPINWQERNHFLIFNVKEIFDHDIAHPEKDIKP